MLTAHVHQPPVSTAGAPTVDELREVWWSVRHLHIAPQRWHCSCGYVSPVGSNAPCPHDGECRIV